MPGVAIAAANRLASDAGRQVAETGGNAVDAAIASALVAMISEPGVCALGGGGFVSVIAADGVPTTIDGNVAMPGIGLDSGRLGRRSRFAEMAYGGGVTTTIGYESVGVPGGVAALGAAAKAFGSLPWGVLVEPAIAVAAKGFPLSTASHEYLVHSHEQVFGWDPVSYSVLHDAAGHLIRPGDVVVRPDLADTLMILGSEGAAALYTGSLASVIVDDFAHNGGLITAADLEFYEPTARRAATTEIGDWTIATNPPPAVGGPVLLAMLEIAAKRGGSTVAIVDAQEAAMRYRTERLDTSADLTSGTKRMLSELAGDGLAGWLSSPSTIHVSSADSDANACSITMSSGYGSGVIPAGTGMWMNNSLGEEELNRRGFHALEPGARLVSNMAPTLLNRRDGGVLAIGSPGADRITTALQQTVLRFVLDGVTIEEAIEAHRVHVELEADGYRIAHEPRVDLSGVAAPSRGFDSPNMFFGGVTAAGWDPVNGLVAAADPRRTGGTATT